MKNTERFENAKNEISEIMKDFILYQGATTDTNGFELSTPISDDEDDIENSQYFNKCITTLAGMADIRHIGQNIWYTSFNRNYQEEQDECRDIIESFIEDYDWSE